MLIRFDNLEFCVDMNGFLYSPKSYNDNWDFQTKALWLRSIGMNPERIAKKLKLNVNTLKNKEFLGLLSLDYPDKNYKIRHAIRDDWSDRGYVDIRNDRHTHSGGSPQITDDNVEIYVQTEMDGELKQICRDSDKIENQETPEEPKDLYEEYYGNYKN